MLAMQSIVAFRFYDRKHMNPMIFRTSTWLAMKSAVLARAIPSVCLSVTLRYCVQTNKDTIMPFSASGRTILLVSGRGKVYPETGYSQGITPSEGVKVRHSHIDSENLINNRP